MALSRFLETASCGFVDMVVKHVPSPAAAARGKVARCYSGPLDAPFVKDMVSCKAAKAEKLVMHVTKLYSSSDGRTFDAFARIYSGTCKPGQRVRVLGEGFVPNEDDEDTAVATIESIAIPRGRNRTQVTLATAGNWVLLTGVDATIAKTATIVGKNAANSNKTDGDEGATLDDENEEEENPVHIFAPLKFPFAGGESTMKLALEPLNPAELPKMVQGLRSVSKAYPMVKTRVEESGEHVLFGTGELYMDCVLHDLRHVYGDVEVKVADPSVALRETVVETSSLKCFAETTNKKKQADLHRRADGRGSGGRTRIREGQAARVGPAQGRQVLPVPVRMGPALLPVGVGLWGLPDPRGEPPPGRHPPQRGRQEVAGILPVEHRPGLPVGDPGGPSLRGTRPRNKAQGPGGGSGRQADPPGRWTGHPDGPQDGPLVPADGDAPADGTRLQGPDPMPLGDGPVDPAPPETPQGTYCPGPAHLGDPPLQRPGIPPGAGFLRLRDGPSNLHAGTGDGPFGL
mmetsp:Transcript_27633/g.57236  ORF Transcript_27633/g.57236 Transcript_27633/m.57236 type:complete len:515 (+) Transcript_27633:3-1547(+)